MDPTERDEKINAAGPENLARLENNLLRNRAAMQHLRDRGISSDTVRKFHLGIKEPYTRKTDGETVSGVLCYPALSASAEPLGRYGCCNIPGVTRNPEPQGYWSRGRPRTYHSGEVAGKASILLVETCEDLWVLDQRLSSSQLLRNIILVTSTHARAIPAEWNIPSFWASWEKIYIAYGSGPAADSLASQIERRAGRQILRVSVPEGEGGNWADFFLAGGTAERFEELLRRAHQSPGTPQPPTEVLESPGESAAEPVNINGAFVNGHLYYPFTVERREVEKTQTRGGESSERVVTSYVTRVVRSDGAVLDVVRLPAPRGTPRERQVLALTDLTRVERAPQISHYMTWRLESIQEFVAAAARGEPPRHRPLKELVSSAADHMRSSVWLPYGHDYTLIALYAAMSYVYQVFDSVPLLMVTGEKGSGKSELGDAIAGVSCNATVVGQSSVAGVVRLLNETRGLVVLDDLESVGRGPEGSAFGDINQMLKQSYKKRTGRRAVTGKNGKTMIFDFYGPKVINNTKGVDEILGSRMLHVRTRKATAVLLSGLSPGGLEPQEAVGLRNELHVWAMGNARALREQYLRLAGRRSDRREEIFAPLRAIALLADDPTLMDTLDEALARQGQRQEEICDPADLLMEAVNECIRRGAVRKISSAQLRLELTLIGNRNSSAESSVEAPVWLEPEWVGLKVRSLGLRTAGKVVRIRLFGIVTRVYELQPSYVDEVITRLSDTGRAMTAQTDPLAFCERRSCRACPYDPVCAQTIPDLKKYKEKRVGGTH